MKMKFKPTRDLNTTKCMKNEETSTYITILIHASVVYTFSFSFLRLIELYIPKLHMI